MTEPTKTPGQINYEAHDAEVTRQHPDVISLRWDGWEQSYKDRWESAAKAVADHVSAPLLKRIEELERFQRPCQACGTEGATVIEKYTSGSIYVCAECHTKEIAARVAEENERVDAAEMLERK